MEDEKYINKTSQGGQISINKRNCLFTIALATLAFNCEAWNIEDQKNAIGSYCEESTNNLYYRNEELKTQKGVNLKKSLDECEEIIKCAWNCRQEKLFENIVSVKEFNASLNGKNEQEQNAQKNGLVLLYCAYKYFKDLGGLGEIEDTIKECAGKFNFSATADLKHDINWYLTDKKWDLNDWLRQVLEYKSTDILRFSVCNSYNRYLELKRNNCEYLDELDVYSTLKEWEEFTEDSNKEKQNIKALRESGKLSVMLTKEDIPGKIGEKKEYRVPKYIGLITDDCLKYLEGNVNCIILPSCVAKGAWKRFNDSSLYDKDIIVEFSDAKPSKLELTCYKELKSSRGDKVKARIDGKEVDIQVGKDEDLYLWCTNEESSNIRSDHPILNRLKIVPTYKNLEKIIVAGCSEEEITDQLNILRENYGYVEVALTKEILLKIIKTNGECRIPKYITLLTDDCWKHLKESVGRVILPSGVADYVWSKFNDSSFSDKEIIVEFGDAEPSELELIWYKELKSSRGNKVKARIGGEDVDIRVDENGDPYLWCTNKEYSKIKDTDHPILKKLTVIVSESYNKLKELFADDEEAILQDMEEISKEIGCKRVGAVLTKDDLSEIIKNRECRIPKYIGLITDDGWKYLKKNTDYYIILPSGITRDVWSRFKLVPFYKKEIRFEFSKDSSDLGSDLECYKELKYSRKDRVKARINGKDVDIEVDKDENGNQYFWCTDNERSKISNDHPILDRLSPQKAI